jgi:signal transduction histidine kinase/CheY-like chemotaxis protein
MKVRSHLILLVTAILLPTILFSLLVLNVLLKAERAAALRSMQELARASVGVMDREATYAMATAQTLSTSRNLDEGEFAAFYNQAVKSNSVREIHAALIDERGQQVFNTVRPFGTRIPAPSAVTRERVRKVLDGGKPVFSDLIKGSATGKFVVSVEYPVTIADGRRFVLNEWMFSDRLNGLLPSGTVPATWLIAVFDRKGMTIARNKNPGKFVGEPPRGERLKTILAGFEGISRAYTRDGVEMYGAWERSEMTGWTVGVGVPVAEIEQNAVKSVALTAVGFCLGLLAAVGGAVLLSRRLVGAINQVSAAAELLPQYRVPPLTDSGVDEMNRLHSVLHQTARLLVAGEETRQQILEEARDARVHAEQAQKLAEEQNRAKDDFLAMLGHELRNPLAAISSGVSMLSLAGTDGERAEKVKAIISRQTRHLTHLVDELLDAHRILNGKITLARKPIDLKASVEACLASFETRGAMRTHRVSARLASAMILGDPTRLEQMVCNLIDNALKYTPEGGAVSVTMRIEDDQAVLAVADSGIGLPPDLLEKAFDVFVQGKVVNRSKGGLGIGLAVVDSLAKQHGATLAAESPGVNQGSTFTLRFPLAQAAPPSAGAGERPAVGDGARVLVIEDNRDVREMMFLMLREHGFVVEVAEDGATGIASACAGRPDVALVDIDLPDMSGYDVAARLKEMPQTASIPLVAVTGYGQAADQAKALQSGFDLHFTKPVAVEALVVAIGRLTGRTAEVP